MSCAVFKFPEGNFINVDNFFLKFYLITQYSYTNSKTFLVLLLL